MSLETGGSVLSSSWTVREVRAFADDFTKIESRVDQAIIAISMMIIGPIALSMLVLMDAVRGANHIVESLYWGNRVVKPSQNTLPPPPPLRDPIPVIDPRKEILDEMRAVLADAGGADVDSAALIDRVLELIRKPEMDEEKAIEFVRQVFAKVGESEAFKERLGQEAFDRMHDEFLADFIAKPLEAAERVGKMGLVLEALFSGFRKETVLGEEDIVPVMNAIRAELRKNLDLPTEQQLERVAELDLLIDVLKNMGFPKEFENSVEEMHQELFELAGEVSYLKNKNDSMMESLSKLDTLGRAIGELNIQIGEEVRAIEELRAQLPKEKTIKSGFEVKAQPGNSEGTRKRIQAEIEELQKAEDLLREDDQKFEELTRQLSEHQGRLEVYLREFKEKETAYLELVRDEFGGVALDKLPDVVEKLQSTFLVNRQKIAELTQEIERSISEDDIIDIVDLDEPDSPVRPEDSPDQVSPVLLLSDTPTPTPLSQPQGWGPWLRSWIY